MHPRASVIAYSAQVPDPPFDTTNETRVPFKLSAYDPFPATTSPIPSNPAGFPFSLGWPYSPFIKCKSEGLTLAIAIFTST